jgi:hypothetical protein
MADQSATSGGTRVVPPGQLLWELEERARGRGPRPPRTKQSRVVKRRLGSLGALSGALLLLMTVVAPAMASGEYNLTTVGSSATINDALFTQGPLPSSAGTGVLSPFLQVKNVGKDPDIEKGYNTNAAPQFDEQKNWTKALLLSTVPIREYQAKLYRVLFLDINQVGNDPDELLSLDQLKLFLVDSATVTDYDEGAETFGGVSYPKIYDLDTGGDSWIKMNYSLEAGSGKSDLTALIPEDLFDSAGPTCDYGQAGCHTWLTVWNLFGTHYPNTDGFEEWSTEVLPFVQISKTAAGTFDRQYDWTIDKSGDPLVHSLFAGGTGTTDYEIPVDQAVTDSNFKVTGTVTITVPSKLPDGDKDAPDATVTSLSDVFDQSGTKTTGTFSDCTTPFTVKAGSSLVCHYAVVPPNADAGVNTATAVITDNPTPFMATADVTAFTPTIKGYPTVHVTDKFGSDTAYSLGSASADKTFTDSHDFTCSTDSTKYTDGFYSYEVKNVATIVETGQTADETVTVNCYAPVVTKDVTTYWDRNWDWTITKDYDASYSLFAGDSVTHGYKVDVVPTKTDNGWGAKGSIYVHNPNPDTDMTLTSVSDLAGGITGMVSCPSLVVPKGGTLTCTYDTGAQNSPNSNPFGATNTATAVFAGANWTGSHAISFSATPTTEEEPVITVDDNNLTGEDWSASRASAEWTYSKDFACSSDPNDYQNGTYSYSLTNTAKINETGQTDTATVDVDCYAPVVSKTAAGTYDKTYSWTIDKTADGEYWKFIGDPAWTHDFKVAVDQSIADSKFLVSGTITVENPNPDAAMTVALKDVLSTGETATLTDCTSPITVPAGGSKDCKYEATPASQADGTNTATATLNGIDFAKSLGYTFTPNVVGYPTVNVTDTQATLGSASIDSSWTYSKDYSCPADQALYIDGVYEHTYTNTATITETGDQDSATVKLHCYAPVVSKDATATFDRKWDWTIDKRADQTSLELAIGQSFQVNYQVTVDATKTDSGYLVTGKVYVENPSPNDPMDVTVSDEIGDTAAAIDCGGGVGDTTLTVAKSTSGSCDYKVDFGTTKPSETTNVATVTFNSIDFTAPKAFTWALDDETDECIDLTDSKYGDLGTVCAGDAPKTFKYSMFVGPYEVCDTYQFKNIATLTTNDTDTEKSADWTVDITVPCAGCTLTQGYWKTHSELGPAPYDDAWALLDTWYYDGTTWIHGDSQYLKSQELFFSNNTTSTWFDVFWTPPAGNAYYQLAHQYEAAVLNILNEASAPASVTSAISHAEALFEQYTPADIAAMKGNQPVRKDFIATAGILGSYNTGTIGPGHCDEDKLSSSSQ